MRISRPIFCPVFCGPGLSGREKIGPPSISEILSCRNNYNISRYLWDTELKKQLQYLPLSLGYRVKETTTISPAISGILS